MYEDGRYNKAVESLLEGQVRDSSEDFIYPEVITPLKPKMLDCLTIKQRSSLILNVIGSMSYREIGSALGCSHTQVSRYMDDGLKKLRIKYKSKCINNL